MADVEKSGEASHACKVYCKCGEGWTCEIFRTDGNHTSKSVIKCGNGCICEIGESGTCVIIEGPTDDGVICKCPDGWSCIITKTDSSSAGKGFAQCGEGCKAGTC